MALGNTCYFFKKVDPDGVKESRNVVFVVVKISCCWMTLPLHNNNNDDDDGRVQVTQVTFCLLSR